jgi:hypothetical protein
LRFGRGVDKMDKVRMNLAQRNQRPKLGFRSSRGSTRDLRAPGVPSAEFRQECSPVALDQGTGIIFRESEVKGAASVGPGKSGHTRGKSVDEPWKFAQVVRTKNGELALPGKPIRH